MVVEDTGLESWHIVLFKNEINSQFEVILYVCFFHFEESISRILEQESNSKRGANVDFTAIKAEVARLKKWVANTEKGITEGVEESHKMMESFQTSMTSRSRKHSVGIQDLRDEIETVKSIVSSERKEGRRIDEGKIVVEVRDELMPEIEYEVDSRIESKVGAMHF